MASIEFTEEINAWQTARKLTKTVYSASNKGLFGRDFALRDQIRRASISIMSNIAEGFERGGTREFIQFLSIAKGSAGEVDSQLHIACDQGYILPGEFQELLHLTNSVKNLIGGLIRYLKQSGFKGYKFKKS